MPQQYLCLYQTCSSVLGCTMYLCISMIVCVLFSMCYDHVSSVLVQVRLAGIVVYENDICWLHTAFQAESRWSRRGVTLLANHTSTHHRCPRFMDWHPFMHRCLLTLYSSCISMVLGSIEGIINLDLKLVNPWHNPN